MMNQSAIERWLEHGWSMLRCGLHDAAIDALRRVLGEDPDHAAAHALLALALLYQKRLYAAEHEARAALLADPDESLSHLAIASVAAAQRRLDDAWSHCKVALSLAPEEVAVHLVTVEVLRLRSDRDQARKPLEEALALFRRALTREIDQVTLDEDF